MIKSSKSTDGVEFPNELGEVDSRPGYLEIQRRGRSTVVIVRDWLENTVTQFRLSTDVWDELVR